VGERDQIPPMYSALKVDGQRLYKLARAGIDVDRAPRRIRIETIELQWFRPPNAAFSVVCATGTYVRALVRDVGEALGCGATLTALRRTRSGRFTLAEAIPLDRAGDAKVIPVAEILSELPEIRIDAAVAGDVRHGRKLAAPAGAPAGPIRLTGPVGELVAIVEADQGRLRYLRVFAG